LAGSSGLVLPDGWRAPCVAECDAVHEQRESEQD